MKYITLLCDGMADTPVPSLGGKTPMEAAFKPHMDQLYQRALTGLATTVPASLPAGSDVANLSVFGYDPLKYYTGRSPLEALSIKLHMGEEEIALRCNLVTLSDGAQTTSGIGTLTGRTMVDYSAGEITTEEAALLLRDLAKALDTEQIHFHAGISYRHCMLWNKGSLDMELTPPHDISGRGIDEWLPKGMGADIVMRLMEASLPLLATHPVNRKRQREGKNPANAIWLWGQGSKPSLPSYQEAFGIHGSVISAVDLIKGIGIAAGLDVLNVVGATGNFHTNYRGKAEAAIKTLKEGADFVYIHVEAPDECGHQGQIAEKVESIHRIDNELLSYLLKHLPELGEFRILIMPDHPTPLDIRTHTREPVPFLLYDSRRNQALASQGSSFTETTASAGLRITEAHQLMRLLLEQSS